MKNIMKRAWELKKEFKNALFSECLKEAWKEVKEMKTYIIKDWFYEKELTYNEFEIAGKIREVKKKYGTIFCSYSRTFTENDIIKETEKAMLVSIKPEVETEKEHKSEIWIPKSVVKEIDNANSFEYFKNFDKNTFGRIEVKSLIDVYKLKQVAILKKADKTDIKYCIYATNKNNINDTIELDVTYAVETAI